ncbi:MAG: ATP-binding cassette domain-containing protein [Saprospiraceae bacterium]|nr:ATP-binding cassette domain-containing protein [Saprospiraceae bacterium]
MFQIDCHNLSKSFGLTPIFKNFTYKFDEGSYGIAGANGSGKSTLIKILSGFLTPTNGNISFIHGDKAVEIEDLYRYVSIAAPYIELYPDLTVLESIDYQSKFKSWYPSLNNKSILDLSELSLAKDRPVKFLSSGMRQRLKLTLCLLSDTNVMILDEPTTNLDINAQNWFAELFKIYGKNRLSLIASNEIFDLDLCQKRLLMQDFK